MDHARADALAARSHLAAQGWIPRNAETFRHLPPPDAPTWLGAQEASHDAKLSTAWKLDGADASVQASWLDAADPGQRFALVAGLPAPGSEGEAAPFAWAHRALVRDGVRLRVAPGPAPVVLRVTRDAHEGVEAPLLVVELLPGAQCVLVETHAGMAAQNLQVHVRLGTGARLDHWRVVQPRAVAQVAHHVRVHLAEAADYRQRLLATGAAYHLQRTQLDLDGPGAAADARGVLLAADAALEQQVHSRHAVAGTRSAVETLALGSGAARIVANASTLIEAGCTGANARQRLAGIPTAGQPKLILRPHLEIHHDNVQAAHGATWGALPEEALFHARQRGLGEAAATAMIVEGLARALLSSGEADAPAGLEDALAAAVRDHLAPTREQRHG
jgi:Fe-S cluster assembly protein SufD